MARIEILNRELYLNRARNLFYEIRMERAERDREYERRWRKMPWPFKDLPETKRPPFDFFYPSLHRWDEEQALRRIIEALSSENTGTVYLDSDEFSLIAND